MPDHPAPAKLGEVHFPVSCKSAVQPEFNRAVALLHSFAYSAAATAFREVSAQDPQCAMAHWGVAMTFYRQLWEPAILPGSDAEPRQEISQGLRLRTASAREEKFLKAAALVFADAASVPYRTRAASYERAMADLAAEYPKDDEVQVFYALALLANASPADKAHARQKQAAGILEPLLRSNPQHPGVSHYLIHAYDNAEMAQKGLAAARLYSKVAPSAPHALHMPSHIFTRLGLWQDSIAANLAARDAAHRDGDTGEELHAMDYLVYAYLQSGRDREAIAVAEQAKALAPPASADLKVGYASTAMPIRCLVERGQWADAALITPPKDAPPHVVAIAIWARGIGLARSSRAEEARKPMEDLQAIESSLQAAGNDYWATQVRVMRREVAAWTAQASHKEPEAVALLRQASDEEDALEKLPVTPGPIIPAREQLGDLLLQQGQPSLAAKEFQAALILAPGRRGALEGAKKAAALQLAR